MERNCKKDFQGWKGIMALKLLCCNIAAGRFNWRKYCTPQPYYGHEICVIPLHSSYGQIGYTVYFPYSNMPEVEYDWEMGRLTVDEENWQEFFQQSLQRHGAGINVSPISLSFIVSFLALYLDTQNIVP